MDRYTLFFIINLPFIIFGVLRAFAMFQSSVIAIPGLISRLVFWIFIALALGLSRDIYAKLYDKGLVNSRTMSLSVLMLATGIIFCFFLIIRVYSKLDAVEKRQAELLTMISIINSEHTPKD